MEIWSLPEIPAELPDLKLVDHARWPISRGDRGQIWCLAVNDTRSLIAFGGQGAQQIGGDLSVADSAQGRQQTILPPVRANEAPPQRLLTGHLQSVSSASFSPNGEWLASISLDGDLRLWSVGNWTSRQLLRAGQNPGLSIAYVQFISNTQLIASITPSSDPEKPLPQLIMFTIGPDQQVTSTVLNSPHRVLITALGFDPSTKRWYSGDANGRMGVWRGNQLLWTKGPFREIPLRSISAAANGLVLALHSPTAATVASGSNAGSTAYIELQRLTDTDSKLVERREWGQSGETLAAAISRDGKFAAVTRPGEAAIEVFALVDQANVLRPQPFIATRPTILAGNGYTVQRVQFASQPASLLAISTSLDGTWTHGFNLATAEVIRPDAMGPLQPLPEPAGWIVRPGVSSEGQTQNVEILAQQVIRATVPLSFTRHGHYAAHAWIFEVGKAAPSAVAIGTTRQNGIYLIDLRPGTAGRMLRYYRDHTNSVISISQSADRRYMASSSRDQTVRLWSMEGLFDPPNRFSRSAAWGGNLEIRNGRLIVTSLMEPGILKIRGLEVGDQIVRLVHESSTPGGRVEISDAVQILKAMESLDLTTSAMVDSRRNNADRPPFIITPAWEPMLTLFIDRRQEWAAWTPLGYYNASVNGDELFGFHLNGQNRGDPPEFFPAEQFRQKLERPDLLKGYFAVGSFTQAAKTAGTTIERVDTLAASVPSLRIVAPQPRQSIGLGQPASLRARATYSATQNPADFLIQASVGGVRLSLSKQTVIAAAGSQLIEFEWSIPPDPGEHLAVVRISTADRGADSVTLFEERTVPFVVTGEPPLRRIHLLAIGAENYAGDLKIQYCNNDAKDFATMLERKSGRFYEIGHVQQLTDDTEPGRFEKSSFQRQLSRFKEKVLQSNVRGSDLVAIFISGHGCAIGTETKFEYYFIPPVPQIHEFSRDAIREHAIPWTVFREFIDQFPCDRVFFIDTCYAGNVTQLETDKAALRPLKDVNTVVFAATSLNQLAKPDHADKHGLFTEYLLRAFRGDADGSKPLPPLAGEPSSEADGRVSLQEMIHYVSEGVERHYKYQKPRYTPTRLLRFLNEPLTIRDPIEGSPNVQER